MKRSSLTAFWSVIITLIFCHSALSQSVKWNIWTQNFDYIGSGSGGSVTWKVAGSTIVAGSISNFIPLSGQLLTPANNPAGTFELQIGPDPAIMLSRVTDQAGTDTYCRSTTGNDAYTCTLIPVLSGYTRGMAIQLDVDTTNTGAATVAIDGLAAKSILTRSGGALADGDIPVNKPVWAIYDGTQFVLQSGGAPVVPSVRGPYSSLPTCDSSRTGQTYRLTDRGLAYRDSQCDGSSWQWYLFGGLPIILPPILSNWTDVNTFGCADVSGTLTCSPAAPGSQTFRTLLKAVPAAPFTVEIAFNATMNNVNDGCGLMISDGTATSSKIQYLHMVADAGSKSNQYYIQHWSTYTSFGGQDYPSAGGASGGPNGPNLFRYRDDNTNRNWEVQTGSGSWLTLYSEARTANFTATNIGIGCQMTASAKQKLTLFSWDAY